MRVTLGNTGAPSIRDFSPLSQVRVLLTKPIMPDDTCVYPQAGSKFMDSSALGASWFAKPVYSEMGISSILILSSKFILEFDAGFASPINRWECHFRR